jgi:hypothetical protein
MAEEEAREAETSLGRFSRASKVPSFFETTSDLFFA